MLIVLTPFFSLLIQALAALAMGIVVAFPPPPKPGAEQAQLTSGPMVPRAGVEAAAYNGDVQSLQRLLRGQPRLANSRDWAGWTPLHWAASGSRAESIDVLLRFGANVEARTFRREATALHMAASSADIATVQALLDAGADPGAKARKIGSPLDVAERRGRADVAALLRHALKSDDGAGVRRRPD